MIVPGTDAERKRATVSETVERSDDKPAAENA